MDEQLGRQSRDRGRSSRALTNRCLETPDRRNRSRSRSSRQIRSASRHSRQHGRVPDEQDFELGRQRVQMLEMELRRERERLQEAEGRHRASSRRASEHRARSRIRRDSTDNAARQREAEPRTEQRAERRSDARRCDRSRSPTFTKNDFANVLSFLKDGLSSQPVNQSTQSIQKIDHKNILPNFDPSTKNQRIDVWLKKVNECASVYGWDDRTTTHFAMQKLQGLAKTWYEGLNSILFTWLEWQEKLINAFPCEQNYGQTLEDMLKRKSKFNEPIEVYYYEKLALVNQCDIEGKRAVDCIIHGLSDRTLRSGALALRCRHPDQLLQFLMSNKDSHQPAVDRSHYRNKYSDSSQGNNSQNPHSHKPASKFGQTMGCYNCKEKGHSFLHCPKPLLKCQRCHKLGHTVDTCFSKTDEKPPGSNNVHKTMSIDSVGKENNNPNSKFIKDVTINGTPLQGFIDFGSEVTLIKESIAQKLGLIHDHTTSQMKGFGNNVVQSLGEVVLELCIDGVTATVSCKVVTDCLLEKPVLIGQTFTEQPHIVVHKNVSKLEFFDNGNKMPYSDCDIENTSSLKIRSSSVVQFCGPISIRARVDPSLSGSILLKNSIAGKPNQQYSVCGGLYYAKNGFINIVVVPHTSLCQIPRDSTLGRAERVDFVNRIVVDSPMLIESAMDEFDESQVRIGDTISDTIKQQLLDLLRKYKHCFASSLKTLGCTSVAEMNIELNSQRPVVYRPYRLSHHERSKVRSMVDEMLEAGIVRESSSEYASPILLVRKKDGSLRMCVDYRMLNSVTVKERYPMPIIEDEIARLSGQACFISLDLASGYYQVPIAEQSKRLTSFVTPDGQYEFNRMPFGLANAPAVFQRTMNTILGSARFSKATAYMDDILIFGKDPLECLNHFEEILQLLKNANLTLNLSKCDFLRDKIDYLGYEIGAAGVRPGEKKISSVMHFPRPESVHNVRQFLGLASYFRKFVQDFAQVAFPLSKLLKKGVAWEWSEKQEAAFENLKARLVDRPILAIYDPSAETELHTDASRIGVGGILLQRSKENTLRPVAYYSRQTSPEEKNFHSYELETLAVVCSLRKFRVYLLGKDFKIVTDCSALRSTFTKRDLIPRIARWWLQLQEFDCTVEYRAGTKMTHVDALSRNPVDEPNEDSLDRFPAVMAITSDDWLHTLQLGDSELRRIRDILDSHLDEKGLQYIKDNYVVKDNKLYRCVGEDRDNVRWVVPKGARWQLCRMNHDDIGHFGVEKTLERLKKNYWFPKMTKFVKKYVNACIECAYAKKSQDKREGLLHPITKVEVPFHTLHIDHLGPFVKSKRGFTYLLVVVDAFTKFCFIKPVRNTHAQNVVRVLEDIFRTFRTPDRLVSDRGSCFTSHMFKKFCLNEGIKHVLNAVASPRSNGQVERYNRTILDSMKALNVSHGEKEWDNHLGKIQWGLNNTVQKTTGRTPAEVLFGTCMNVQANPILNEISDQTRDQTDLRDIRQEVKDRTDNEQVKQKEYYDKGRKPARIYAEGELVKITKTCFNNDGQSKKLLPSYVGPYRVTKVLGSDRYIVAPVPGLSSTRSKRPTTVAADRMTPWIHLAALEVNKNSSESSSDDD